MKKSGTKRALFLSVLSIVLCLAMLMGSTFAWFTDSVSTGVNKIIAGNLDVELSYKEKTDEGFAANYTPVTSSTAIFNPDALWEPGHCEVAYLKVENVGSLALKYAFSVNVANEVTGKSVLGEDVEIRLSDYLKFGVIYSATEPTPFATRGDAIAAVQETAQNLISVSQKGKLAPKGQSITFPGETETTGDSAYVTIVVYMPTDVGDAANYRIYNAETDQIPSIDLGVSLVATQTPYEKDSFDEQYDIAAMYSDYQASTSEELSAALASAKDGDTVLMYDGSYSLPTQIPDGITISGSGENTVIDIPTEYDLNASSVSIQNVSINVAQINEKKMLEVNGEDVSFHNVILTGGGSTTYDASINVNSDTITFDNTKVSGAFRAVQVWSLDGTLLIENSVLSPYCYTFNVDSGTGKIIVNNSTLQGWTSYTSTLESATFTNCVFEKNTSSGSYGYNVVAAYTDSSFDGCQFGDDFAVYAQKTGITWKFDNCKKGGTNITAENFTTLFPEDSDVWNKCTCIVNGVQVVA